ncbi:MAG: cardiolipin synthase [Anaerolineae bacterium]|nr:cardiolipin synthase [Anaerolineae bacterium]
MADLLNHLPTMLWWLIALYALSVAVFILLENRSPHLTLSWLFAFIFLPVIGVLVYIFFGRGFTLFSQRDKLIKQELTARLRREPVPLVERQDEEIERLKQAGPPVYGRVVALMRHNADSPLFPYNCLEILQNGAEKYPRLLADLKVAHHSIHMEYFEWSSDELMQEFKQILLERAKAGIEVRLLYDPLGSFLMLSRAYVREMNAGGVRMIPYSPLTAVHTISYRNHRKLVIIDGKIGYTGGLNMAETYLKGPQKGNFTGWRDTHVRFTGEAVWGLQASFIIQWFNSTGENLVNPAYFPPLTGSYPYLPLQIVNSGPDSQWKAIRDLYFALITAAQRHIYIQSPFFILDESLIVALNGAARTGVDVKIMLAPAGPDSSFPYQAGVTYAENIAKAGGRIFYYQGEYFHPKTINIDSVICSIGSANMDIRSFTINYESNLVIYDEKTAQELEQDFLADLNHCIEFDLAAYRQSGFLGRLRDSTCRLVSPVL